MPKRSRSPIRDTKESLSHLTRRQLQAKAKSMGVKANMKSEVIIAEIVQQLREAEELEEEAASSRRASSADIEQQSQVMTPVAQPLNDENPPAARSSRSRTRASAGTENRASTPPHPQAGSAGRSTGPAEAREAKRRRIQIEEAERLASEAEEAAEQARVAKQKADIALAVLRLDENMPRAVGQTLYEREPTPIERPADATPVPLRGASPEPLPPITPAASPLGPSSGAHSEYEAERKRLADQSGAQLDGEDDEDKENDVYGLDEEADKENRSPSATPFSPTSSKNPSVLGYRSPSPNIAGPAPPAYQQPEAVESRPIAKSDIRETLRKLTSVSLKLEGIQKEVDRSQATIQKMRNTAKKGAKMIETNFAALNALEDHLLKHVKRNPTILDGNGLDETNGGPAREEALRRAYYNQQRKDWEEIGAKEAEKARRKRAEQAAREAAKANKEALEEGSSGSSDGSLELDPNAIALINAGGDLMSLLEMKNRREEEDESQEGDDDGQEFYDSEFSSEDEEGEQRPSDDGGATPPRVTRPEKNVSWGPGVKVQWEVEEEDEDGEVVVTRFSN